MRFRYSSTVNCPAVLILITPPHMHIKMLESVKAGKDPISTVGSPTTHGATVAGTQGIGVKTPAAAAVAAATVGLETVEHTPKGMTLTNGLLSMIVAANMVTVTLLAGNTIRMDGAAPKEHCSTAPPVTRKPIVGTPEKISYSCP